MRHLRETITQFHAGHSHAEMAPNPLREQTDAPGPRGATTPYTLEVGQTFTGTQSAFNDRDSVKIDLVAGETYTFSLKGAGAGAGTLQDAFLTLYAPEGFIVRYDDDSGTGEDAVFTYTAPISGTFVLSTGDWYGASADSSTGTYELSVVQGTTPPPDPTPVPDPTPPTDPVPDPTPPTDPDPTPIPPTDPVPNPDPTGDTTPGETSNLDELADYLSNPRGQRRSFEESTITVNLDGLTTEGQKLARWSMETWEAVADINFVLTSGAADITFDDELPGAFARSFLEGDKISRVEVNISSGWIENSGAAVDGTVFQTYIHELGHAIGLGHLGPYNGGRVTYGVDNVFANDSKDLSVMSYFPQNLNPTVDADYAFVTTAQRADIVAIQDIYGAPGANSQTIGNTVYGQDTNLTGYAKILFDGMATGATGPDYSGRKITYTVYDEGGVDTLNFGYSAFNQKLNLNDDTSSNIDGVKGGLSIARGTVVENAVSGAGNDILIGNHVSNRLTAGGGNDTLSGGAGNDILSGGADQDTFQFFDGMDQDRIIDFSLSEGDKLVFDNALWGGATLTAEQLVNAYSSTDNSGTTFTFGEDKLTVDGLTNLTEPFNWIEFA